MGLTLYYDWKTKTEPSSARRMIAKFRAIALKLPFDETSEIYEQDPPDGRSAFRRYDHSFRQGALYLSRTRADGEEETVCVPALHALFFHVRVEGSETASIGLASHPPVVLHKEDLIERNEDGSECGRRDDSRYAKHRDVNRLLRCLRDWDAVVARFAGSIGDALGDESGTLVAPIKDRPDFEHLEAKGVTALKRMAARQRRRRKKGPS